MNLKKCLTIGVVVGVVSIVFDFVVRNQQVVGSRRVVEWRWQWRCARGNRGWHGHRHEMR